MRTMRIEGFSLLETLAAMFLLALCFGALMQAAGASMALNARASDYTQASLWASGLIDRQYVAEFPTTGTHVGRFDDVYRWTMTVSEPAAEAGMQTTASVHLYRIEVIVEWDQGGKPAAARFATQRLFSERPPAPVPIVARSVQGDG